MNPASRFLRAPLFLAVAALTLAGCWKDRLAWSPDGSRAAVIMKDGLYLCDPTGRLSPLLAPGAYRVAWLDDSQRLLIARAREFRDFAALSAALGPERTKALATKAEIIWQLWQRSTDKEQLGSFFDDDDLGAVAIYLREHHGAALRAKLAEDPKNDPKELDEITATWHSLAVARIAGDRLDVGAPLYEGLASIHDIRPAPGHSVVAFVTRPELSPNPDSSLRLLVVPLDRSAPPTLVASSTNENVDWTPDGRALVYLKSTTERAGSEDLQLGTLTEREVLDAAGRINPAEKTRDLAGLIFQPANRVRCLRDGRVLFDAAEFRLPLAGSERPQNEQLFAIDRTKPDAPLVPLIRTKQDGAGTAVLTSFEVSPDETQVLIAAGADVDILTLATGKLERLSLSIFNNDSHDNNPPRAVWRRTGELTYVKMGPKRQELVLRRDGMETILSRDWPDAVLESLIK